MTPVQMLDEKFKHSDFPRKLTYREFFKKLLSLLLQDTERFSGKRPFGNSGWDNALHEDLEQRGVADTEKFVQDMIKAL